MILYLLSVLNAGVAQLAEQLICNQQVAGSSPIASSRSGGTVVRKRKQKFTEVQSEIVSRHSEEIRKKQVGLAERK